MDIKDIYSFFTMKLPIFNKRFLESHSIFKSPFLIQLNINIHQYHICNASFWRLMCRSNKIEAEVLVEAVAAALDFAIFLAFELTASS
jgi:hypothetical protein